MPGAGSTFWFTVRFERQAEGAGDETLSPGADLLGRRVLIVDDNATNRKILVHQTRMWGMLPEAVESGPSALEGLREAARRGEPYDFAILDSQMPDMDGLELARTIKSEQAISSVRMVMLTSVGSRDLQVTAGQTGIDAYLAKPVRQTHLQRVLLTVMNPGSAETTEPHTPRGARRRREAEVVEPGRALGLILIAEDNIVNQRVAQLQVEKPGYRADVVANGMEAVDALMRTNYGLVLMDCQMPEMDGFEATAAIRAREGAVRHTPIVAMTANAMEGERERCLDAGMDDYLTKPAKQEALETVIARWLRAVKPVAYAPSSDAK